MPVLRDLLDSKVEWVKGSGEVICAFSAEEFERLRRAMASLPILAEAILAEWEGEEATEYLKRHHGFGELDLKRASCEWW